MPEPSSPNPLPSSAVLSTKGSLAPEQRDPCTSPESVSSRDPGPPSPTPPRSSFDYAVIRVVPRVELEEFLNAGVIVFCLERRFLAAHVRCEATRLHALWPALDLEEVSRQLDAFRRIAAADPTAGPIARLSLRERFHWLVSPRNTIVQVSPVHTGLTTDPAAVAIDLLNRLVPRASTSVPS